MATVRQSNFSGGELSPSLWGRDDLDRYGKAARTLLNYFASKSGAAVSRPGAEYLGRAYGGQTNIGTFGAWPPIGGGTNVYVPGGTKVRLVPFYWSDTDTTQNYVLEFGARYFRVLKNGVSVAGPYGTPYLPQHLFKLRFAQSGDVVFLACAGYPPAKISRTDETHWAYAQIDFARPVPPPAGGSAVELRVMEDSFGVVDGNHPALPFAWVVTELRRDQHGQIYETAPVRANGFLWFFTQWNALVPYASSTVIKLGTNFFRSKSNANTGHKPVDSLGATYTDNVTDPWWQSVQVWDTARNGSQLHYGTDDIVIGPSGGYYKSLQNDNYNHAVTVGAWWQLIDLSAAYQTNNFATADFAVPRGADRPITMWLANGAEPPTSDPNFVTRKIYGGRQNVYGWLGDCSDTAFVDVGKEPDYTVAPPQGLNPFIVKNNDGSILRTETPIAVTFFEDRLAFVGTQERGNFIFLSKSGDYTNFDQRLIPYDDDALVFALASRKRELARSAVGLDKLLVFTDAALWTNGGAGGPMAPDNIDSHVNVDIGADWPAPLIIEGAALWVRNKGTGVRVAAFDSQRASQVSQDLSFVSEHLVLGHKIIDWCYAEDPWGVVWVARDDGVLLSLTYAPEDQIWAWAPHSMPYVVQSICTIPEGDEDAVYLAVNGRPLAAYSAGIYYAKGDVVTYLGNTFASLQDGNVAHTPPALAGDSTAYWEPSTGTAGAALILRLSTRQETATKTPACVDGYVPFDGPFSIGNPENCGTLPDGRTLHHLNGAQVWAQYDNGEMFGPYAVAAGAVVVSGPTKPANKLFLGIPYNCDLETLDVAQARTRKKVVNDVGLEVKVGTVSQGSIQVGPDVANLKAKKQLAAGTQLLRLDNKGAWSLSGRIYLRHSKPFPVTILGITREVDVGQG